MPTTIQFLKLAWPVYQKNFLKILGFFVVEILIGLLALILIFLAFQLPIDWLGIALSAVVILAALGFLMASLQAMIINVTDGKGTDLKNIFSLGVRATLATIAVVLLASLAQIAGFILLIIPGLILMVWFAFVLIDTVKTPVGAFDIIRRSVATARKAPWHVANLLFVASLIATLMSYIPLIGVLASMLVFYPVWMIAEYMQYKKLAAAPKKIIASSKFIWSTILIVVLLAILTVFDVSRTQQMGEGKFDQKIEQQIEDLFGINLQEN